MEYPRPTLLAYSTSWVNIPIASFLVWWPTWKLAELRTHRQTYELNGLVFQVDTNNVELSMNANSSRAIPFDKQEEMTRKNPFVPIWTRNKSGMQGDVIEDAATLVPLRYAWKSELLKSTLTANKLFKQYNLHKQDLSALIQPWSWTLCVITADFEAWKHFFELRCNPAVYPAVRVICDEMRKLLYSTDPVYKEIGEWHCAFHEDPYVSASKCARISFNNQEKEEPVEKHHERAHKLFGEKHYSIAEHQYKVPDYNEIHKFSSGFVPNVVGDKVRWVQGEYVSNVKGWIQFRKLLEEQLN